MLIRRSQKKIRIKKRDRKFQQIIEIYLEKNLQNNSSRKSGKDYSEENSHRYQKIEKFFRFSFIIRKIFERKFTRSKNLLKSYWCLFRDSQKKTRIKNRDRIFEQIIENYLEKNLQNNSSRKSGKDYSEENLQRYQKIEKFFLFSLIMVM